MMPDEKAPKGDDDEVMDHVAMEAIHSIHNKDKDGFRNSFHVLVADILHKISSPMENEE